MQQRARARLDRRGRVSTSQVGGEPDAAPPRAQAPPAGEGAENTRLLRALVMEMQAVSASIQAMVNLLAMNERSLAYDPRELAANVRALLSQSDQDGRRPNASIAKNTPPLTSTLNSTSRTIDTESSSSM
jgi:hypothetical protein